jgi:sugar lactone lactonase YvrE
MCAGRVYRWRIPTGIHMQTMLRFVYLVLVAVTLAIDPLSAQGAPGDLFASIDTSFGNGVGAIYQYTPAGVQTTLASGLSRPRGLAFDSAGNLLVATNFCDAICHARILKIAPDGAHDVFATLPNSFFGQGLVIDQSDNVFVVAINQRSSRSIIYRFTSDRVPRPFAILEGQSFGLAVDGVGNLFAAGTSDQTIYKFARDGTRSIFAGPEVFTNVGEPIGLAFDALGNLFVSTSRFPFNDDKILKFSPSAIQSTFATRLNSPRGLAFDSEGNLFVAEIAFFASGDILKFTPDGTRTVFASGIGGQKGGGGPEYLAIQP